MEFLTAAIFLVILLFIVTPRLHDRLTPHSDLMEKPYILISNDDGIAARGLNFLVETLRPHADLLVVAPDGPRSGMSMSITSRDPLRYSKVEETEGLTRYKTSGTPADCIKMAVNRFITRRPDLIIGGIHHGANSSVNAHYSGTMGVAIEGALQG